MVSRLLFLYWACSDAIRDPFFPCPRWRAWLWVLWHWRWLRSASGPYEGRLDVGMPPALPSPRSEGWTPCMPFTLDPRRCPGCGSLSRSACALEDCVRR